MAPAKLDNIFVKDELNFWCKSNSGSEPHPMRSGINNIEAERTLLFYNMADVASDCKCNLQRRKEN